MKPQCPYCGKRKANVRHHAAMAHPGMPRHDLPGLSRRVGGPVPSGGQVMQRGILKGHRRDVAREVFEMQADDLPDGAYFALLEEYGLDVDDLL